MIYGLKYYRYEDRLRMIGLTTLEQRRKRANVIEVFKIINGLDKLHTNDFFELREKSNTRGHCPKLFKKRFRFDGGKYFLIILKLNNYYKCSGCIFYSNNCRYYKIKTSPCLIGYLTLKR